MVAATLVAIVASLWLGVGAASAMQALPGPVGGAQRDHVGAASVQLIPAVSATIVAPAPGVAIELIPATSATLPSATRASEPVGARVVPAAVHLRQISAAGDAGAAPLATTTVVEGSVSIELIPATSSQIAPATASADADSAAARAAGGRSSSATAGDGTRTDAATETTGAESISVLAESSSIAPAGTAAHSAPPAALPWVLVAAVALLLAGAALMLARARRPIRH